MAYYVFPNTVYDQPANLLAVLGSWWARDFAGTDQVSALVDGKAQIENQSLFNLMEVIASISRFSVPIYHTENWYPLYLLASQRNDAETSLLQYDGSANYDQGYLYDVPKDQPFNSFPCPPTLINAPLILNRFTDPTMTQNNGIDFVLNNDAIIFRNNPFDDPRVATRIVYTNGIATDTEAILWVYQGQFDWDLIYQQFAYVIGLRLQSSAGYRDLMNAIFNAIVGGTSRGDIMAAFSAMTGVPLVRETIETVTDIVTDPVNVIVITDQHVYKYGLNALPIVQIGDIVTRGAALTDALQFFELNCGVVPDSLAALAIGQGFLATCFYGDLVFEDKDLPLTVITDDESGYTKVTWPLGGFPLDVDKFFDELHARGVTAAEVPLGQCDITQKTIRYPVNDCGEEEIIARRGTLAHYLDLRPVQVGEPTASQLPQTVNPLRFLVQNILRNNAAIVRIKAAAGNSGVGLHNVRLLRKVIPPETALIVIVDLTVDADSVTVGQLVEQLSTFVGMTPLSDTVTQVADNQLTIRIVNGTCQ